MEPYAGHRPGQCSNRQAREGDRRRGGENWRRLRNSTCHVHTRPPHDQRPHHPEQRKEHCGRTTGKCYTHPTYKREPLLCEEENMHNGNLNCNAPPKLHTKHKQQKWTTIVNTCQHVKSSQNRPKTPPKRSWLPFNTVVKLSTKTSKNNKWSHLCCCMFFF
jgi:hypothetical protein